ncbi:FAD/NAD(P)-binding protein [Acidobacteriota bacterium]
MSAHENHAYTKEREIQKNSIYLPEVATLTQKKIFTPFDTFFEFELKDHCLDHLPGQFVEVSIPGVGEAPISISSPPSDSKTFEMVIRNVGTVTNAIHSLEIGGTIGVRGPYGTSFPMEDLRGKNLLFVAGGIGLVPTRSAILYAFRHREDYKDVTILFGCKDPVQRLFVDELKEWKKRDDIVFHETVDTTELSTYLELTHMDISYRGPMEEWKSKKWTDNVGVITTLFPKLKGIDPAETYAIVVGPPVMYKFVIMGLHDMEFPDNHIILSLERRMKCGVGKCGHCQMDNIYVCQEGPVFYFEDIKHLKEAI